MLFILNTFSTSKPQKSNKCKGLDSGGVDHLIYSFAQNESYRPWKYTHLLMIVLLFYKSLIVDDLRLKAFGQRIKTLRKEKGLSQESFAALANIDRSYMGHIERGSKNITLTKIYQIADALELDVAKIFDGLA